jgi:hypothetical protein
VVLVEEGAFAGSRVEKDMCRAAFPREKTLSFWLAGILSMGILLVGGCKRAEPKPSLTCALVELRPDIKSNYYDAVVRMESATGRNLLKDRFQVTTPTSAFNLSSLEFTVEGKDPARLEAGDTFIIPLKRPDWRYTVTAGGSNSCSESFWDLLPPADRWHPTKTEAMDVARSITIVNDRGLDKPMPASLPGDWKLVDEKLPDSDDPLGSLLYREIRGQRTVAQVEIQYSPLTPEDQAQLAVSSPADFLSGWSECAKKEGRPVVIAGHPAVACDLEGVGDFGWTYRYFYISSDLVIAVDVQSDPREAGTPPEEKEQERRTNEIFLRYGYGPVDPGGWQVMIEIRMNRTGILRKRSSAGEAVDKDFTISDEEFAAIEKSLADNHFDELGSRAGGSGFTSFLSVRKGPRAKTVTMENYRDVHYESIARTIRNIVLPKVGENEMQPPNR